MCDLIVKGMDDNRSQKDFGFEYKDARIMYTSSDADDINKIIRILKGGYIVIVADSDFPKILINKIKELVPDGKLYVE